MSSITAKSRHDELIAILQSNAFHFGLLDDDERALLVATVRTFIDTKYFEGCGGLEITDEVKVTIASQACLMLLGRENDCFRRVRTILVYPSGFNASEVEGGTYPVGGMAYPRGPVLIGWEYVLAEARDPSYGGNVVIHEFAHQIDMADGHLDGTLDLVGAEAERWRQVFPAEYERHRRRTEMGKGRFLGNYAASNMTEFFATASERFFTVPLDFIDRHPVLYQLLAETYHVDPAAWFEKLPPTAAREVIE